MINSVTRRKVALRKVSSGTATRFPAAGARVVDLVADYEKIGTERHLITEVADRSAAGWDPASTTPLSLRRRCEQVVPPTHLLPYW